MICYQYTPYRRTRTSISSSITPAGRVVFRFDYSPFFLIHSNKQGGLKTLRYVSFPFSLIASQIQKSPKYQCLCYPYCPNHNPCFCCLQYNIPFLCTRSFILINASYSYLHFIPIPIPTYLHISISRRGITQPRPQDLYVCVSVYKINQLINDSQNGMCVCVCVPFPLSLFLCPLIRNMAHFHSSVPKSQSPRSNPRSSGEETPVTLR